MKTIMFANFIITLIALLTIWKATAIPLGNGNPTDNGPIAKKSYLSIPQNDPDPTSRATRLANRASFWELIPYSQPYKYFNIDAILNAQSKTNISFVSLDVLAPFQFPSGILGETEVAAQAVTIYGIDITKKQAKYNAMIAPSFLGSIQQIGLTGLNSFLAIYNNIPTVRTPTSAPFWDSDLYFSARRLTVSPYFITRVNAITEIPFNPRLINGLSQLLGNIPIESYIATGQVFMEDYTKWNLQLSDASVLSTVEAPVILHYIKNGRLMPLAIKFTLNNQNIYSPVDSHADWFLAKAVANAIGGTLDSKKQFTDVHVPLIHIAAACQMTLATEHPVYFICRRLESKNYGIAANGRRIAGDDTLTSAMFPVSNAGQANKIYRYNVQNFHWNARILENEVITRGIKNIPNFYYYHDGSELYTIFQEYFTKTLKAYYTGNEARAFAGDTELQAFLTELSKVSSFPTITSVEDLGDFLAQAAWLATVEHQGVNSDTLFDHKNVYPHSPCKFANLPAMKGVNTDVGVLSQNLVYLGADGFIPLWLYYSLIGYVYKLDNAEDDLIDFGYDIPDPNLDASKYNQFRKDLIALSNKIATRNAAIRQGGLEPDFPYLDPRSLPFSASI